MHGPLRLFSDIFGFQMLLSLTFLEINTIFLKIFYLNIICTTFLASAVGVTHITDLNAQRSCVQVLVRASMAIRGSNVQE